MQKTMGEAELAEQLSGELDRLLLRPTNEATKPSRTDAAGDNEALLETALLLTRLDWSGESQGREHLRLHLLAKAERPQPWLWADWLGRCLLPQQPRTILLSTLLVLCAFMMIDALKWASLATLQRPAITKTPLIALETLQPLPAMDLAPALAEPKTLGPFVGRAESGAQDRLSQLAQTESPATPNVQQPPFLQNAPTPVPIPVPTS
jgi:hypothetical protein